MALLNRKCLILWWLFWDLGFLGNLLYCTVPALCKCGLHSLLYMAHHQDGPCGHLIGSFNSKLSGPDAGTSPTIYMEKGGILKDGNFSNTCRKTSLWKTRLCCRYSGLTNSFLPPQTLLISCFQLCWIVMRNIYFRSQLLCMFKTYCVDK